MKTKLVITVLTAGALLIGMVGCKKQEPSVPQAVDQTKQGVVGSAVEAAKTVADTAQAAAKDVTDKAQVIIDQAKNLINDGKFQDALTALGGLSGMTLTDAQQKVVDGLKAQIQKGIADQASKQAGSQIENLLKK